MGFLSLSTGGWAVAGAAFAGSGFESLAAVCGDVETGLVIECLVSNHATNICDKLDVIMKYHFTMTAAAPPVQFHFLPAKK